MTTQVELIAAPPVARIRLSGSNGIQLLGADTRARLRTIVAELASRTDISVVVFEAEGRVFIAGADINELRSLTADNAADNSREGQSLMNQIAALKATTIAAIHGACAGGGCELSLACDLRIAASSARIGLPETSIGIIPGWGGTVRATRLLGGATARRMILTGELLSADAALRIGLVDEVIADDAFRAAVDQRVASLLTRGPQARAAAKRLTAQFEGPESAAQFEAEALAFAECYRTGEPAAGMNAFLEKRAAQWPAATEPTVTSGTT